MAEIPKYIQEAAKKHSNDSLPSNYNIENEGAITVNIVKKWAIDDFIAGAMSTEARRLNGGWEGRIDILKKEIKRLKTVAKTGFDLWIKNKGWIYDDYEDVYHTGKPFHPTKKYMELFNDWVCEEKLRWDDEPPVE